jgi:nitrogen fixation/metabolism regulation signal transduction histidine kinase
LTQTGSNRWRAWPFAAALALRGLIAGGLLWAAGKAAFGAGYWATATVLTGLALVAAADLVRRAGAAERTLQTFAEGLAAGAIERPARRMPGFGDVASAIDRAANRLEHERISRQQQIDELEALVGTVASALFVLSPDGRIAFCNRAARNLAGEEADRLERMRVIGPELGARLAALPPGAREVVRLADGRAALASAAAYAMPGGERRRLIALQTIAGELDAVEMKAWQDLVRTLAHEMMNSLTPVVSLAESLDRMLRAPETDAVEAAGAAQVIARRSAGLMSFVERYRRMTDLPPPKLAPVAMGELVAALGQLMHPMLADRGIDYGASVEPPDLVLTADAEMLEQAALNLLKNAMEAVEGTAGPRIRLACRLDAAGAVVISVADNGPGLPADAEGLFLPFFTTKAAGSGIGLSVVRQVALAHHGRVTARTLGPGAEFALVLPPESVAA